MGLLYYRHSNDERTSTRAGNDIQFTERRCAYACLPNIVYMGTCKQVYTRRRRYCEINNEMDSIEYVFSYNK